MFFLAKRPPPCFSRNVFCRNVRNLVNISHYVKKNSDPSCFDPIQKFGMSTWGLTLIFDPVPSTYFRPPPSKFPQFWNQMIWPEQTELPLRPGRKASKLVWDVTCVDLLAPSRIENGSVANPGTGAEDAQELETAKYVCLTDKRYIFQPLAFEIHGGVGPSWRTCVENCACSTRKIEPGRFSGRDSRNPGRQCSQCSWSGSGRRPLKRTLLLVNLCSMTVLFNQELYAFFASLSLPFHEPHWVSVLKCPRSIELSGCMISFLNSFCFLSWLDFFVRRPGWEHMLNKEAFCLKRWLMTTIQFWFGKQNNVSYVHIPPTALNAVAKHFSFLEHFVYNSIQFWSLISCFLPLFELEWTLLNFVVVVVVVVVIGFNLPLGVYTRRDTDLPILWSFGVRQQFQNWIVVINQRFLKNASVFIMCPQPGRQTKKIQPT